VLAPFYRWQFSPDDISYLTIARAYATGHWWEAINGYWGVLWCWLLTPLIAAGVPDAVAAPVLMIAIGAGLLWGTDRLVGVLGIERRLPWMLVAVVVILGMVFERCGPDLLLATILVHYFGLVFRDSGDDHISGWRLGVLGGLAYLTKSYGFYFFGLHITAMTVLWSVRHRRLEWRRWAQAMAVFAAISSVWIGVLSVKYGQFTIARNGEENIRKTGPDSTGYFPIKFLQPPPSPLAVSAWQDPPVNLYQPWSRFGSARSMKHQIKMTWRNVKDLARLLNLATWLWGSILLAYVFNGARAGQPVRWVFVATTFLLYPVGYMLVVVQDRYLWALHLLLLGTAAVVTRDLLTGVRFHPLARVALPLLLMLSFVPGPLLVMYGWFRSGKTLHDYSVAMSSFMPAGTRLASCGRYEDSLAIAYQMHAKYYGIVRETMEDWEATSYLNPSAKLEQFVLKPADENVIQDRLRRNGVEYVLVWPSCVSLPQVVANGRQVDGGRFDKLKIYDVRAR
jgi:hypothetical protein